MDGMSGKEVARWFVGSLVFCFVAAGAVCVVNATMPVEAGPGKVPIGPTLNRYDPDALDIALWNTVQIRKLQADVTLLKDRLTVVESEKQ